MFRYALATADTLTYLKHPTAAPNDVRQLLRCAVGADITATEIGFPGMVVHSATDPAAPPNNLANQLVHQLTGDTHAFRGAVVVTGQPMGRTAVQL